MTTVIGEDPVADSRNGEYVIVEPPDRPDWPQERWDDYQRDLVDNSYAMWLAGHPPEVRRDELR